MNLCLGRLAFAFLRKERRLGEPTESFAFLRKEKRPLSTQTRRVERVKNNFFFSFFFLWKCLDTRKVKKYCVFVYFFYLTCPLKKL
jgi:hypothetical protein